MTTPDEMTPAERAALAHAMTPAELADLAIEVGIQATIAQVAPMLRRALGARADLIFEAIGIEATTAAKKAIDRLLHPPTVIDAHGPAPVANITSSPPEEPKP